MVIQKAYQYHNCIRYLKWKTAIVLHKKYGNGKVYGMKEK